MSEELLATTPPTPYDYGLGGYWISTEKDNYEGIPVNGGKPEKIVTPNGYEFVYDGFMYYIRTCEDGTELRYELIFWDYPGYYTFLLSQASDLTITRVIWDYYSVDKNNKRVLVKTITDNNITALQNVPEGGWYIGAESITMGQEVCDVVTRLAFQGVVTEYTKTATDVPVDVDGTQWVIGSAVHSFVWNGGSVFQINVYLVPKTSFTFNILYGRDTPTELGTQTVVITPTDVGFGNQTKTKEWSISLDKGLNVTSVDLILNGTMFPTNPYNLATKSIPYTTNGTIVLAPNSGVLTEDNLCGVPYVFDLYLETDGLLVYMGVNYVGRNQVKTSTGRDSMTKFFCGRFCDFVDPSHPSIILELSTNNDSLTTTLSFKYNQAYLPCFERYYKFTKVEQVGQNLWKIDMETDVLATALFTTYTKLQAASPMTVYGTRVLQRTATDISPYIKHPDDVVLPECSIYSMSFSSNVFIPVNSPKGTVIVNGIGFTV